ncbi:MAG: sensor histidine kinase [Microcoleaceae cyanobacterium]
MDWGNFLYLAIGLAVGLGVSQLLSVNSSSRQASRNVSIPANESDADIQAVLSQLKQAQIAYQMALEMGQFKGGFLARISHELRSPLNSMIGMLQLIITDLCESPEEEREFTQEAYNSALKFVGILDEIVQIAKLENGTEQLKIKPFPLAQLMNDVEQLTYLQAANRSVKLLIEPTDPELQIHADPVRIKQILVDLIETAIIQTEEGKIQVSTLHQPGSDHIQIYIDDQRPVSAWSESWQLLQDCSSSENPTDLSNSVLGKAPDCAKLTMENIPVAQVYRDLEHHIRLSSDIRLWMHCTLLQMMEGRLEIVESPAADRADDSSSFTRTLCTIPIV